MVSSIQWARVLIFFILCFVIVLTTTTTTAARERERWGEKRANKRYLHHGLDDGLLLGQLLQKIIAILYQLGLFLLMSFDRLFASIE